MSSISGLQLWGCGKKCSKCEEIKDLSEFHKNRSKRPFGADSACKACVSVMKKKKYQEKKKLNEKQVILDSRDQGELLVSIYRKLAPDIN